MPATRESVFAALFAAGEAATFTLPGALAPSTWVTTSRRLRLWSDVPEQPALFQTEPDEDIKQVSNLPYRQTWHANWVIYQKFGTNPDAVPATYNNLFLDACLAALAPRPADPGFPKRNTLGGLVYHVFVDGTILKVAGDLDDQGMIVVPITILVP